jgi:hypothetical protein
MLHLDLWYWIDTVFDTSADFRAALSSRELFLAVE